MQEADVLIIGSGACGAAAAWRLSQGTALRIVQTSSGHHDEFDEGPNAGDDGAESQRQHGDEQLCDASTGVSKVEVVDAKDAEEQGEKNADKELFGRVLLHHHHLALAHWGGHGLSGHHGLACLHASCLRDRDRHRLTGDHHLLSGLHGLCLLRLLGGRVPRGGSFGLHAAC